MSITTSNIEIRIAGNSYEDYEFTDICLVQDLQQPNELHFTLRKKIFVEEYKDITVSLSDELLGKRVTYSLITDSCEKGELHEDYLQFEGIIFNMNIERDNSRAEIAIEVTAYSPDYLLRDNSHCYSYVGEKLQDIVAQTLAPYEIRLQNNPRLQKAIPYAVQYNETNYAFLQRLATRFGEWLYYDGKQLVFGKVQKSECIELPLEHDVLKYNYLLDMQPLNFSHAEHNYLVYKNQKAASLPAKDGKPYSMNDAVHISSKSLYKKVTFEHLQSSSPENNFDETEFSVEVKELCKKAQMMQCVVTSRRAGLKIGSVVQITEYCKDEYEKIEKCEHRRLLICGISHYIDNQDVYYNRFTAIPADSEYPPYEYNNTYPKADSQHAVVKDNKDPEKLGRVRVQFLWQQEQDTNLMTPWIRIAQPHGGGDKGFYFIPEIDEEVIAGFENGNAEKPYVIGTLYHGQQRPDGEKWYSEKDDIKAIRTRSGHTIEFHDTEGKEKIEIYDHDEKRNFTLTFSAYEQKITLHSKGDIELEADENIKLTAGKNIIVIAQEENISLDAKNDISAKAENNIKVNAENDMTTTVKNNNTVIVNQDQIIKVDGKNEVTVVKDYQLQAKNIHEKASDKMQLSSKTHEQKADNMKLEGTRGLEAKGLQLKEN